MRERLRLKYDVRRESILSAAFQIAREHGLSAVTRDRVAAAANCANGTVNNIFVCMDALRNAVVEMAVEQGEHSIVASGLAERCNAAVNAPDHVKKAALETLY